MGNSNYKELFIKEFKERLKDISYLLLDLVEGNMSSSVINNLFREFHSIKGMATIMNIKNMSRLSQGLENLLHLYKDELDSSKKEGLFTSKETIDLLMEGTRGLESMIQSVEEGKDLYQQDYTSLIEKLEGFYTMISLPHFSE